MYMRENKETQQKSPLKRNQAETVLYNVPCVRLCDMMSEVFFMQKCKCSQTYKPKVIMELGISSKYIIINIHDQV